MRILIGTLAVAMLVGCSTPSDQMAEKPQLTATSMKAPKVISLCAFPAWQDYRSSSVMSETLTGYRIVAGSEMNRQTDDVLNIEKGGNGSIVKLYQRAAWSQIGRAGLIDSLNRCL